MDTVAMIVGASWIAVGLITIGLAIPLLNGKVGRNPYYGARFSQSFASDEAWFAINRFAAKRMMLWSPGLIGVGLLALFLPLGAHPGWALILAFAPLVLVVVPAIEAWRFAKRYGRGEV